ncbi:hypothetical protein M3Y98_00658400 [Aphelenchoides besseyi]|nr:hypothetical protein M3Y98_00658400 [Aphelenchoides besseyi]KAI6208763.1 hypothetical protein M3Y96_00149300 [Aphelenchoides besseyi]
MEGQYEPIGNPASQVPPTHTPSIQKPQPDSPAPVKKSSFGVHTPTDIRPRVEDNQYEIPNFVGVQQPPPQPAVVQSTPMIGNPVVMMPSKRAQKTAVRVEEDVNLQTVPPSVLLPQSSTANYQNSEAVDGAAVETPTNQPSEADPTKQDGIKEGEQTPKSKRGCSKSYTRCQCFCIWIWLIVLLLLGFALTAGYLLLVSGLFFDDH